MRYSVYARFWRIGFGSLNDLTLQRGSLIWNRRWWRIWTADTFEHRRSMIRQYLTWRLAQARARLDLRRHGVIAACDAMKRLNRCAKHMGDRRHAIYDLKRRFIGELLEQYPCVASRHEQIAECFGCAGTGTWLSDSGRHADQCYRCNGTGVHRRHQLLLLTFTVHGREYRWHQPLEHWPNIATVGEVTRYEDEWVARENRRNESALARETLTATVIEWIESQGLPFGTRVSCSPYAFWPSVRDDAARIGREWRDSSNRALRWIEFQLAYERYVAKHSRGAALLAFPTIPKFPTRGAGSALEDADLPF